MMKAEAIQAAVGAVEEAERLTKEVEGALFSWQGREAKVALVQLKEAGARLKKPGQHPPTRGGNMSTMNVERLKHLVRMAETSQDQEFFSKGGGFHQGLEALSPEDRDAFMEWTRARRDVAGEALAKVDAMDKVIREVTSLMRPGETLEEAAHRLPPSLFQELMNAIRQYEGAKAISEVLR